MFMLQKLNFSGNTDRVNPFAGDWRITFRLILAGYVRCPGSLAFHMALQYIDLGTEMTIFSTIPFFTITLAFIFLKEKIKPLEIFLTVVSVTGVTIVILTSKQSVRHSDWYFVGVSLVFLTCILWSSYFVPGRTSRWLISDSRSFLPASQDYPQSQSFLPSLEGRVTWPF